MANTNYQSVDDYIASQPAVAQPTLDRVRKTIRKALPTAEEVISYQIPAYKIGGRVVIYFAGWKEHFSIYPATRRLISAFAKDSAAFEVKGRTLRFPLTKRVPARLIAAIAKFRASEATGQKKTASGK